MLHHYISLYFSLPPNSLQRKQLIDLLLLHKDRTKSWTHENIRRYFYKHRFLISSRRSRQQQNRIIHSCNESKENQTVECVEPKEDQTIECVEPKEDQTVECVDSKENQTIGCVESKENQTVENVTASTSSTATQS